MKLDLSYAGILARIRKFDIYIQGGENMSKEQAIAFDKVLEGRQESLAFSMCQESEDLSLKPENIFIASDDQIEAYEKEFNCKVQFRIGIGQFFIDITSNVGK